MIKCSILLLFSLSVSVFAGLVDDALNGGMKEHPEIVFCTRGPYKDGHWYANIGYFCDDVNDKAYHGSGKPDTSALYRFNLKTKKKTLIFDAKGGTVRDPHVDYDGKTIIFSYRPLASDYGNLYQIQSDGSGLKRITNGPWDDIEPCRLPNGDILFVSTRCRRWVSCMRTQVATLYRCKPDGSGIFPVSANVEHDNTPAVLPDGRILFTRWEYVDRSQVEYHHLWTMNPDGTNVNVFYGNMHNWILMIDALPIPGSHSEVLAIFSPGHGRNEHAGQLTTVSPLNGPDDLSSAKSIGKNKYMRDPQAIDKNLFMVANGKKILLIDRSAKSAVIYDDKKIAVHEPRLLRPRKREPIIPDKTVPGEDEGHFVLMDVYQGRHMTGIKRGDIKKLLIMEQLPKPNNFSGGADLTSYLGTFNLERVLGTVPVYEDGSASFIAPAGRALFFIALDENDMSVKRMQSFTTLMPGEKFSCVGCHEERSMSAEIAQATGYALDALERSPSRIKPFEGIPDVLDFERDIQPILTKNCVSCHNSERYAGKLNLERAQGPRYSNAFLSLFYRNEIADGRNGLGNQPPRTLGSSASRLMRRISGNHKDVKLSEKEWRTVWMWIESAAPYAGSYAALQPRDLVKHYSKGRAKIYSTFNRIVRKRCVSCHKNTKEKNINGIPLNWRVRREKEKHLFKRKLARHERLVIDNDPAKHYDINTFFDISNPENSRILKVPLAKKAGGYTMNGKVVFKDKNDPDYKKMLAALRECKKIYNQRPKWARKGWSPSPQYIREMKRFGILPESFDLAKDTLDPFVTDQQYWASLYP